jgi:pimeloyl-ACP methyl ester carboxylesterase
VTPDGVTVAVQDWAGVSLAQRSVLLLHGFSQSHGCWQKQLAGPLARDFHLVTYDLRGHGASEKPDDALYYREAQRWADELNAVIQHAKLTRPVVVVWSYAGRVVLDYLKIYGGEHLGGLVFVNATTRAEPDVLGPATVSMQRMCDSDPSLNVAATRALLDACVARPLPRDEFEFMLDYNLAVPARIRAHLRRPDAAYRSVLQAIQLPTLIIHGALDPINLPTMAAYTHSQIPGAKLIVYEDVAHMPFWESPQRFDLDLTQFINQI